MIKIKEIWFSGDEIFGRDEQGRVYSQPGGTGESYPCPYSPVGAGTDGGEYLTAID